MGLSERVDKLEEVRGPELCSECGGRIVVMDVLRNGTWVGGNKPCGVCGSLPPEGSGRITRVEVVVTRPPEGA